MAQKKQDSSQAFGGMGTPTVPLRRSVSVWLAMQMKVELYDWSRCAGVFVLAKCLSVISTSIDKSGARRMHAPNHGPIRPRLNRH